MGSEPSRAGGRIPLVSRICRDPSFSYLAFSLPSLCLCLASLPRYLFALSDPRLPTPAVFLFLLFALGLFAMNEHSI